MATRKPSELLAAGMKRVLRDAAERIAKETLQRGATITVVEGDEVVQIRPDGTRHALGIKVKPAVSITQTRFRIG